LKLFRRVSGMIEGAKGYVDGGIPVFHDRSFANELSFNGAVRRIHYSRSSDVGVWSSLSVTTYKYGGAYEPIPAIRLVGILGVSLTQFAAETVSLARAMADEGAMIGE
jgi:hypothetical protein